MSKRPVRRSKWVAGPGLVLALAAVGPGDLVSNTAAGATHGLSMVWVVALGLALRYAWIDASARYVLVTGETLVQGFARVNRYFAGLVLLATLLIGHLYAVYLLVLLGDAVALLLPSTNAVFWSLLSVAAALAIMARGGYPSVERTCVILAGLLGASLAIVALLSRPDPMTLVAGLVPRIPEGEGAYSFALLVAALIGTEIGSTTNLGYAYFIRERGWTNVTFLPQQRRDLLFGVTSIFVLGLLIQIAAAGSLGARGIVPETAADMGRMLSASQGTVGLAVFAIGLWAAAFTTFVGGFAGAGLVIADGYRVVTTADRQPLRGNPTRDPVYRGVLVFWCVSALYVFWLETPPVLLTLVASSLLLLVAPLVAVGLLRITNDPTLMGEHRNGLLANVVLVVLLVLSVFVSIANGLGTL